jgi:uncharacterized Zn finger protein (UPF0148 family)
MIPATAWQADEPCPACGTTLVLADGTGSTRQDCPVCGWSATWDGEASG